MLMNVRWVQSLVAGLTLLAMGSSVWGMPEAEQSIAKAIDQFQQAVIDQRAAIDQDSEVIRGLINEIIVPQIDFTVTSRFVLGNAWNQANPDQQKRFENGFKDLLVRTYAAAFIDADKLKITFLDGVLSPRGNQYLARIDLTQVDGTHIPVTFSLYKSPVGWKAYDLNLDGVSLVSSYRSNFASVIRQEGMEGLLAKLEERSKQRLDAK